MKELLPWKEFLNLPATITRPIGLITLSLILVFALGFFLRDSAKESPVVFYGLFLTCVLMLVLAGIAMLNAAEHRQNELENARYAFSKSEFLLVVFPEHRTVLADGMPVGVTNQIILLPREGYLISLMSQGSATEHEDHAPPDIAVNLWGTSLLRPSVVIFQSRGAHGGTGRGNKRPHPGPN